MTGFNIVNNTLKNEVCSLPEMREKLTKECQSKNGKLQFNTWVNEHPALVERSHLFSSVQHRLEFQNNRIVRAIGQVFEFINDKNPLGTQIYNVENWILKNKLATLAKYIQANNRSEDLKNYFPLIVDYMELGLISKEDTLLLLNTPITRFEKTYPLIADPEFVSACKDDLKRIAKIYPQEFHEALLTPVVQGGHVPLAVLGVAANLADILASFAQKEDQYLSQLANVTNNGEPLIFNLDVLHALTPAFVEKAKTDPQSVVDMLSLRNNQGRTLFQAYEERKTLPLDPRQPLAVQLVSTFISTAKHMVAAAGLDKGPYLKDLMKQLDEVNPEIVNNIPY